MDATVDFTGIKRPQRLQRLSFSRERKPARSWPHIGTVRAVKNTPNLDSLLRAIAENQDRAAFKTLFEHIAPRLKGFLMGEGTDASLAEEVVQQTMVNVWRKAQQFDSAKATASTWVFTIARNMRIDLIRKSLRPEPDMNDPAIAPVPEPLAHEMISRRQDAGRLHDAIAALPEEQQCVLRLAFFEEKTHPEVAEKLGLPLGTVKSRIRLALNHIRNTFGEPS